MGDWNAASERAAAGRTLALSKLKSPADYDANREAVYLLGTAIEVQAQALAASGKKAEAIRFLDESSRDWIRRRRPTTSARASGNAAT